MPEVIGVEWKVSDKSIERLGVTVITLYADGSRSSKIVRLDGNGTSCALWGLSEAINGINEMLGYAEKFWERPGFHDVPRRKK